MFNHTPVLLISSHLFRKKEVNPLVDASVRTLRGLLANLVPVSLRAIRHFRGLYQVRHPEQKELLWSVERSGSIQVRRNKVLPSLENCPTGL